MKILILGGTRFLGRRLAEILIEDGNTITVLSRHPENAPRGATVIGAEREEGLKQIAKGKFDTVIDFIAFDGKSSQEALNKLHFEMYILISSTWICRLGKNLKANDRVNFGNIIESKNLPIVTKEYLLGKLEAENIILSRYHEKKDAVVLRLPIMWGVSDPTGRTDFYFRRILDGYPLIRINGGNNSPSMAWTEDTARAIILLLSDKSFDKYPIWEGLTANSLMVKDIISFLAEGLVKKLLTIDVSDRELLKRIPEYLKAEPLWMLDWQGQTENNIFNNSGLRETPQEKWLRIISRNAKVGKNLEDEKLRKKELIFLNIK